jgi:CheY-like chemotaxis protein
MAGELILVVDDNDVNCMVAESMLKILGYKTTVAKSGFEALEFASKTKFDLILMDWQMPEMNGFDAATAIWNSSVLNKNTKILAVTANAFSEDRNKCIRHGFKDVLTKPFDVDQLQAMLEQYLFT